MRKFKVGQRVEWTSAGEAGVVTGFDAEGDPIIKFDVNGLEWVLFAYDVRVLPPDPPLHELLGVSEELLHTFTLGGHLEDREPLNLDDYWKAPSGGTRSGTWEDKPHRLLYDLIGEVLRLRKQVGD